MSSSLSLTNQEQQQQQQVYFQGVKKGIEFATDWTKLFYAVEKCKERIVAFEAEMENPATEVRLFSQIMRIFQQMKIEYEELEYLLDDNDGVNRETEFESIQYKLTVFKKEFKIVKNLHCERERKTGIKAKRKKSDKDSL